MAAEWAREDNATFEDTKTELIHHPPGRTDLSNHFVTFDGIDIYPSAAVKWIGTMALTHAVWGLKPLMVRDLARSVVFPRADYGVSSFLPIPVTALRPLERVNKCIAQCITGGYRTASGAALKKEAAILPAPLRLESSLIHRLAGYLCLPSSHGITPLIQDAVSHAPTAHPHSTLSSAFPLSGGPLKSRLKVLAYAHASPVPPQMLRRTRAQALKAAAPGLSPPSERRHVTMTALTVTSDVALPFQASFCPPAPPPSILPALFTVPDLTLGLERIIPVYSPPWATPLPVTTIIPDKEDAVDVLKQFLADSSFSGSTWYTDGSLLDGSAGGAAVRVESGVVCERIVIPLGDGQVTEGEMEGLLRGTERAILMGADHILMVSDSQATLKGIASTRARSGQFRTIQYDELIRTAMAVLPGLRVTNLWTPAHIGTEGNEFADEAAKAATLLPSASTVPVSLTTCRRSIDALFLERWSEQWKPLEQTSPFYPNSAPTSRLLTPTDFVADLLRLRPVMPAAHREKPGHISSSIAQHGSTFDPHCKQHRTPLAFWVRLTSVRCYTARNS
ncbi:hypothetical protein B0H14DRAFT_3463575 [Mycena olivaceomarginata]|nr:hypothetical protein B0H14DRAFT_3463575 [Mycena olivaceomarginata]